MVRAAAITPGPVAGRAGHGVRRVAEDAQLVHKEWADCADLPEDAVDRDLILTNVTLYWLTNRRVFRPAVLRIRPDLGPAPAAPPAPTGVAVFPDEMSPAICRFAERTDNIVHWAEFGRGGHFAAMEAPDLPPHDGETPHDLGRLRRGTLSAFQGTSPACCPRSLHEPGRGARRVEGARP